MKKKKNPALRFGGLRCILFMKFTALFILLGVLQSTASIYSQSAKLTVKLKKVTVNEVLSQIEEQSEFTFLYRTDLFQEMEEITVNEKESSVEDILDKYIVPQGFTYEIDDKTVIIRKKTKEELKLETPELPGEKHPQEKPRVTGLVIDGKGVPIPGATIVIKGTTRGVITDQDGSFNIEAEPDEVLVISFIGMETQEVPVGDKKEFEIVLGEKTEELEDITVVAFGKQKKNSVIASIETVKPAELKVPSSNLTTALAGRMSGLISYQRSGEPGKDNAEFFVRGVTTFGYSKSPLILIDGIELTGEDLARLQTDDIASFSIMKDATATSLYGARGANGVIYVTTKEGKEGKAKISIRYENSTSRPTQKLDLADPITYMKMHNEAVRTRDPLGQLPYSLEKVDKTIAGADPNLYPTTDWYKELFKNSTTNHRLNFNLSGGGKIARYYLAATVNQDNGMLKVDKKNDFNSNIDLKKYQLRSNVNLNVTKSTEIKILFNASFDDYIGPLESGESIYFKVMRTNPVLFKPYYEPDEAHKYTKHILFGNAGEGNYFNPYADMVKGYKEYSQSKVIAQVELHQDLDFVTEGLNARMIFNGNRYSFFDVRRSYEPYYYKPRQNPETGVVSLTPLNEEEGTEWLDYNPGLKDVKSISYFETALTYNRTFNDKHALSGMMVYTMRNELRGNAGSLQLSLPYRNLGLSGRATYAYDNRYFGEFNFGYNGSERFSKKERFGFFPSAGFGWIISNESFFANAKKTITKLKLKGTYGLVGNDAIGSEYDRFFYLSQVNMEDFMRSYTTGEKFNNTTSGVSFDRYANDQISWETATKTNIGIELGLWDKLEIQADVFHENRTNILMDRIQLASMGLEAGVRANVGEAMSRGIDASLDYSSSIGKDAWIQARVNFTYATNEITKKEEPDYSATPWLSGVGRPIGQAWGYVAERLFVDQYEVNNSPEQALGSIPMGGDIKYKDINGDDRITGLDRVPIGHPVTPEIVYGFGFSAGYKNLDFSCFFQGLANESFWVNTYTTAPFIDIATGISNNQLLQVWADSYWSEDNRDVYAKWPRLSNEIVPNNNQTSTWFMQDGSFLRLKSLEIGYSLPTSLLEKIKMEKFRVYASGTNLLTFSTFKLWDPEMGGNGLGYPIQMVINAGIQVSF